jgi:copper oxidase (laccase) domain-containing protein
MSEYRDNLQPETQEPEPQILTAIEYKPGQENKATHLSILDDLPLKHAISWGKDAGNMSVKYSKGQEPEEVVRERINKFLGDNGMEYYAVGEDGEKHPHVIHMIGAFEGTHLQTHNVIGDELEDAKDEVLIQANFVYTTNPDVVMVIRPGDCPVSIVHAKVKDKDGNDKDLLAFIHSSAQSANAGLPRHAIRYLIDVLHVDPATIKIGIAPGVSMENYTITEDEKLVDDPAKPGEKKITSRATIVERNWKDHIDENPTGDPSLERHVDIMAATIMQFTEEGINPNNIQAIDVDSYAASARGEAFSHRRSEKEKVPEGRYMVAAQLKKELGEEVIVDSAMSVEEALRQNPDSLAPQEIMERQRLVDVEYYSFDNKLHRGQIVVDMDLVDDVEEAFKLMRKTRFPINTVIPISDPRFNFDDERSVYANNVSGFNYRTIAGTNRLSNHALGGAIDINPFINPYIRADYQMPRGVDYDPNALGALVEDGEIVQFFKRHGWEWGGDWTDRKDYQHFQKPTVNATA